MDFWDLKPYYLGHTCCRIRVQAIGREAFKNFSLGVASLSCQATLYLPIGSIVVPFGGSYLESYKVLPKRNYYGAYGYF